MGSWCETDGITTLPINENDEVRVFILHHYYLDKPTYYPSGTCYPNDMWSPLGFVQGKYNDYGGIKKIKSTLESQLLLNDLKQNWNKNITLQHALECIIREDDVEYKYCGNDKLGIMFVLEDVFQAMINYNPIIFDYTKNLYIPRIESIKLKIENWYNTLYKSYHDFDDKNRALSHIMSAGTLVGIFGYQCRYSDRYLKFIATKISEGCAFDDPEIKQCCDTLVDFKLFELSMMESRKMWFPQSGKGSQENDSGIYKHLNKVTESIILKRFNEDADEYKAPDEQGYFPDMLEHNEKVKNGSKEK